MLINYRKTELVAYYMVKFDLYKNYETLLISPTSNNLIMLHNKNILKIHPDLRSGWSTFVSHLCDLMGSARVVLQQWILLKYTSSQMKFSEECLTDE